jgi:hypothetical protein
MGGTTHGWTTTKPDNPAKDVSARNLNDHRHIGYIDIEAMTEDPWEELDAPPAGKVRLFFFESGGRQIVGKKYSDGHVEIETER